MAHEKKMRPIGVPGAPYPTMVRQDVKVGKKTVTTFELGVMDDADKQLQLPTDLTYPEMMGKLYRGAPVRDMIPAFEAIVERANPEQNNRVIFITSDPGFGKSYGCSLVGKARDRRGPIVTDAGGKNLEYLLFRTVFDTEESKNLMQAIDEGLRENTLSDLSLMALRKLGKHFSEDQYRKVVDWGGLTKDQKLAKGEKELTPDEIRSILNDVITYERWDRQSLGIGFKVEKGPLVLAHEQERDLIIDEMDKCKDGSEPPLQLVWQVLNGELGEHTVPLSSLGSFTFKRGNPGLVMLTGNNPKDGKASHLISESFDRRVPRFEISNFTAGSWTDMTASMLTGLPIPQLHRITPGKWLSKGKKGTTEQTWAINDEEAFTKKLFELTTLGMSDEERRKLKEWQLNEVSNWKNVLVASEKLGEFYHKWAELVDPDSPLLSSGKFPDILQEVDDPQSPILKVTPSTMIRHVEQALIAGPAKKEASKSGGFSSSFDWNNPVQTVPEKAPVEEEIGTRMAKEIMDEIYRTTAQAGKTNLYEQLMKDAKQAGLVGDPPPIAKFLNVDPTKVKGSLASVKLEQNTHAALLRELFPKLGLSANDEDILPLRYVQSAIEQVGKESKEAVSPLTSALFVPNTDVNTVQQRLFDRVAADNKDPDEILKQAQKRLPPKKLLNQLTLLSSLAMASVSEHNLDALWNQALTSGGFTPDEATAMAQNQSKTGIAITSLHAAKGEGKNAEYVTLHVIRNQEQGRTVIVGNDAIPDDLYNRLKRRNIVYINQEHFSAQDRLNSEFNEMIGSKQMDDVKAAFLLRNEATDADKSLAELLAKTEETTLTEPNFVTTLEPESITHSERVAKSAVKSRLLGRMTGK